MSSKALIPAEADLADHARFLEQIATTVGGEFDGWGAEIIESS